MCKNDEATRRASESFKLKTLSNHLHGTLDSGLSLSGDNYVNKFQTIIATILFLIITSTLYAQRVSPYQVGSYIPGLISLRDLGSVPGGLYLINYNYWINSNGYFDKNGNKIGSLDIDLNNFNPGSGTITLDLDTKIKGYSTVPLLYYASKFKLLGGATYVASVAPNYASLNYNISMNLKDSTFVAEGKAGGWGDLSFMPLGLSWSFSSQVDLAFMYTLYAPTGRYSTGSDDNIGKGYWTHQFQVPTYFYLMERATAIGIIPTLEINGKVKDAEVWAGSRFSLEYGISQYLNEWLEIEIVNAHNWQISNDKGDDDWWKGTILDSKDSKNTFAVGVGVWPLAGRLQVRGRYVIDYGVRQRFQNRYWGLSLIFITNLLSEKVPE